MRRTFDFILEKEEELMVLRKWCIANPKAVKIILKHPRGYCPFPQSCNKFPCQTLTCNADECSKGYAFRRS